MNKESALSVITSDELFVQKLSPVHSSEAKSLSAKGYKLQPRGNIYNSIADKTELELLLKGNKISSEYMTNASVVAKFVEKQ
jgi:hypothetical protein